MLIALKADEKKTGEVRNILHKIGDIKTKMSIGSEGKNPHYTSKAWMPLLQRKRL